MQLQPVQPEVIAGLDTYRDFFDIAGAPIAAGLNDADHRPVIRHHVDKIGIGESYRIAVEERGDEVLAFLGYF